MRVFFEIRCFQISVMRNSLLLFLLLVVNGSYSTQGILNVGNKYSELNSKVEVNSENVKAKPLNVENCNDDMACLTMATQDRLGLEAIEILHRQLDDDASGTVDLTESKGFLKEELQYENGAEKRQKAFHRNDDMNISVKELWDAWVKSEVHNWTVEQTSEWLANCVQLPEYVPAFILNRVTGAHLPRLATGNSNLITNILGIKDPIHKQKLILKAMDVVLFGPPKDFNSYTKDVILVSLLLTALVGCYYAYSQKNSSTKHLRRMMRDMECLQQAELDLKDLQKELERAKQEQEYVTTEKRNLEKRLQEQCTGDGSELRNSNSNLEIEQLRNEVEVLRNALQRAEGELVDRYWTSPPGLQLWLQLTHEIENKSYLKKKAEAEKQLQIARDACEKLRKKRSSLVGAFVSTHGKSIDDVDRSIVDARTSLNEVTQELAERVYRWKQIELLCGFNIINNKGLAHLEGLLYRNAINGRNLGFRGRSQDTDDDTASNYSASASVLYGDRERALLDGNFNQWMEGNESSDSEKIDNIEQEDVSHSPPHSHANFIIGALDSDDVTKRPYGSSSSPSLIRDKDTSASNQFAKSSKLIKSASEDIDINNEVQNIKPNILINTTEGVNSATLQKARRPPRKSEILHSQSNTSGAAGLDDETGSTDSNQTVNEDLMSPQSDNYIKKVKSKSKLHFPKFSRKSKVSSGKLE